MTDLELREILVQCKKKVKFGNTNIYRWLSKRSEMKIYYNISKAMNLPLFPGNVIDWNSNQISVVFWLGFYDSIESSYEIPPNYIIENDDELDKWLDKQRKKNESERESDWRKGGNKSMRSATDHDEVVLIEDIE